MRALILSMALCAGCGGTADALKDVHPVSAHITGAETTEVVVMGGAGLGSGTLEIADASGANFSLPVSLSSESVGALMSMQHAACDLELSFDAGDVRDGNDLLGGYDGSTWAIDLGLGGGGIDLENERFVGAHCTYFSQGILSIWAGHTWLGVDASGDLVKER